jgi:hypothetical protein
VICQHVDLDLRQLTKNFRHCCCLQVRLSTAAPGGAASWCCAVKVRREYGKDNKKLDDKPKETLFKTLNQVRQQQRHLLIAFWGVKVLFRFPHKPLAPL